MPRKKIKVQVPVLTQKRITKKVLENNTNKLIIYAMPQLANIALTMNTQSRNILEDIDVMQSNNTTISDNIQRLRRNALSNRILCAMLEDNIKCMKSELTKIKNVLNAEIDFTDESTH